MAQDEGGEKTEEPTPKRRQEADDEGRIPRSQEATIAATILGAAAAVKFLADDAGLVLRDLLGRSLASAGTIQLDEGTVVELFREAVVRFGAASAGIILTITGATFAISALQARGHLSAKTLKLHWDKMDPMKNAKRLLSPTQLVETFKAILKVVVVAALIWKTLAVAIPSTSVLSQTGPAALAPWLAEHVGRLLLTIGLAYGSISAGDYFWQYFQMEKNLRMSKDEVKRESKDEQGDPHIRGARRRFARELAFGQMLRDVATSSVVITNPTHIAVAIRYDDLDAPVPMVIAMGQDKVAERIKEIAALAGVPIVENKPVARALFKSATVGSVIPIDLYMAVAEILAYVFRSRTQRGAWRGSTTA